MTRQKQFGIVAILTIMFLIMACCGMYLSGENITDAATKIHLSKKTATLTTGATTTLSLKDESNKTISASKITWSTTSKSIVTVKDGKLKAIKPGTAKICAKYKGNTYSCKITVKNASFASKTVNLETGETKTLKLRDALKKNIAGSNITWTSSDKTVAKVSSKGKVTAVSEGTASISAKYKGKTYKVTVNTSRVDPNAKSDGVMTYPEFVSAPLDSQVTIEAFVQEKQSWWNDMATVYAQDGQGGYFIYNMECSEKDFEKLKDGTKIRVTGYKGEWAGEVEIIGATFEFVKGGTWKAEATDITDMLGTKRLERHMNKFVSMKGMTVEPSIDAEGNKMPYLYSWDGSGSPGDDLYFNVSVGGKVYNCYVESYLCDMFSDVYMAVEALSVGDVIDMEGFLYWYEGPNPHITSVKVVS